MIKRLLILLLLAAPLSAQNFTTVTASSILNGSSGLLPSGSILFQAVGTGGRAISYRAGGGGQQITSPTVCAVTNGAIVPPCAVANVLFTSPQNLCFQVTVKNSSSSVVLGGSNSGYQCVQPVTNSQWCSAGVCNFDTYQPNLPPTVLTIVMPFPQTLTLGGIYAGDCSAGSVVSGYNTQGTPDCVVGTGGGGSIWGTITGTLSDQTDLFNYLLTLAPITSANLLGAPTTPTPVTGDNSNNIANTAWVRLQSFAPSNSPILTGVPVAPTPATNDSSGKIATTSWVNSQGYGTGTGNVTGPGSSTANHIALFAGSNGQVLSDAGFGFPLAASHIGTLAAGANGLVASATTDTTNAANITSGILGAARLPQPTVSSLGGVQAFTAVSHQWLNAISTSGIPAGSQPACGDLSNAASSCSTDTTNATNISSGTLAIARLGTLVAGQNGLAASATTDTTNATNIGSGTLAITRLGTLASGSNGLVASATTDTTNASNISSGTLAVARQAAAVPSTLTDAATITWAVGAVPIANAQVTLGGSRTLNLTGMVAGGYYTLVVIQDVTGGRALTLGSGCVWKVAGGGSGTITPSTTSNAQDLLAFYYNGTNCYANFAHNFN